MKLGDLSWDDLRVLLAVHRNQSLLAAGRALGLSTSTAGRRLERLQRAVGRPLIVRSTTGTSIEPGALELVSLAEQVEHGLSAAHRDEGAVGGVVRVSTGDGFAGALVSVMSDVRRRHPETFIELVSETRLADLAKREADLGLRTARSSSAVLVERPLGRLSFGLFASESYVERRVRTRQLEKDAFARLDFVGYAGPQGALPHAAWLRSLGAQRFVFRANTDALLLEATRQGQGICVLADVVGDNEPGLVRLTCQTEAPRVAVWLVLHKELRLVPRVRAVAEAIETAFRSRLSR